MGAPPLLLYLQLLAVAAATAAAAGDGCTAGCDLALASYYIAKEENLTSLLQYFGFSDYRKLTQYNPQYPNLDFIPFRCSCLVIPAAPASTYLAGESYTSIARMFNKLTTAAWMQATNIYPLNIPDTGTVDASVNCSCGDAGVSPDYGLFLTYPLWDGETLTSVAANNGFSSRSQMHLLRKYNPGMDGVTGSGIV